MFTKFRDKTIEQLITDFLRIVVFHTKLDDEVLKTRLCIKQ